jgi:hypothetical protein
MPAFFLTNLTHGITHISRVHDNTATFTFEWMKHKIVQGEHLLEFSYGMELCTLTGFLLWRQYWRHFWGSFFTGAYLPQKLDLLPRLESERNCVQRHVPSY